MLDRIWKKLFGKRVPAEKQEMQVEERPLHDNVTGIVGWRYDTTGAWGYQYFDNEKQVCSVSTLTGVDRFHVSGYNLTLMFRRHGYGNEVAKWDVTGDGGIEGEVTRRGNVISLCFESMALVADITAENDANGSAFYLKQEKIAEMKMVEEDMALSTPTEGIQCGDQFPHHVMNFGQNVNVVIKLLLYAFPMLN